MSPLKKKWGKDRSEEPGTNTQRSKTATEQSTVGTFCNRWRVVCGARPMPVRRLGQQVHQGRRRQRKQNAPESKAAAPASRHAVAHHRGVQPRLLSMRHREVVKKKIDTQKTPNFQSSLAVPEKGFVSNMPRRKTPQNPRFSKLFLSKKLRRLHFKFSGQLIWGLGPNPSPTLL